LPISLAHSLATAASKCHYNVANLVEHTRSCLTRGVHFRHSN